MQKSATQIICEVFSDILNKVKEGPVKFIQEIEEKVENNEKMMENTAILLNNQITHMEGIGMVEEANNFRRFIKTNYPKINI